MSTTTTRRYVNAGETVRIRVFPGSEAADHARITGHVVNVRLHADDRGGLHGAVQQERGELTWLTLGEIGLNQDEHGRWYVPAHCEPPHDEPAC
ncbi:hypothetical protein Ppa06_57350 [Planomonospora parontospora subsp. parontospora]|uniref:Uncharacterized protein n=2 Tax=Planomonospora parontospora TaxID=58119 RepID=A0AA37F7N9_9ACTN|nr:hypothetical protein [Planomonospora parontospora]GGK90904.1 hypothetical protein GCM10010126_57950 [Planomonospora parontospora]GII11937.1 hypothetical protein Ppa06_57350 [Planomonospora parontospora subsp. parontospora]